MIRCGLLLLLLVLVAGCGSGSSQQATPTPAPTQSAPSPQPSAAPAATPTPIVLNPAYKAFVHTICHAFVTRNAGVISDNLPRYQYNSGVRFGQLGDGEGQTGDPSILNTWLAGSKIRCTNFSPSVAGHGTLLSKGWGQPGGWSLLDLDTFNGHWRINDFTFGGRNALYKAMQVARPILPYRG